MKTRSEKVDELRQALVAEFGSMWQAASQMHLNVSGGQLLLALQRSPVDPSIAASIERHMGIDVNKVLE